MLRIHPRWHDAANRLLDQEARLLRFAKAGGPGPDSSPVDDDLPPPRTEAGPAHTNADATREAARDTVRRRTAEALTETHAPTLREAREANEKTTNSLTMLSASMESLKEKNAKDQLAEQLPDQPNAWTDAKDFVTGSLGIAKGYRTTLEIIDTIEAEENVDMPPLNVIGAARLKTHAIREAAKAREENDTVSHLDGIMERLSDAETMIRATEGSTDSANPDCSSGAAWRRLTEPQKKQVYQRLNDVVGIPSTLRDITETTSKIEEEMQKRETLKMIIESQKRIGSMGSVNWSGGSSVSLPAQILHGLSSQWNSALNTLGIEFYTPMQLYMAFQDLKEAFVEVKKQRDRGKASKIAALTGRTIGWLPGMRDVELILETSRTKKDDEVKNGFKEALGASNWQPGFNAMFEPGALLDQNIHDKNRSRAILEYAAGNGMLYDISDETANASKTLFGRWHIKDLVPGEWSQTQIDSYWDNLRGDNTSGAKKRAEIGEGLVKQVNKAEEFIKAIDGTLAGRDLWLAKGMIVRAFDKGRESWMSGWIATTVMNRIQNDEVLRKYVPSEWLDEVGLLSAKTAAFTLGYLNFQRNQYIVPWARSGEKDMHGAGHLGNAIEDVKSDILKKNSSLDPTKYAQGAERDKAQTRLNELVAKVLTCRTVDLGNGTVMTIFSRKYDYYNNGSGGQRVIDFAKLSEDFFAEPSEILMSDSHVVSSILELTSLREFKNEYHAKMLFTNAVKTMEDLRKAIQKHPEQAAELKNAMERFRETFGGKMEKKVEDFFTQSNPMPLTKFTLNKSNRPALMAMVQEGFVSLETMKKGLAGKKDGVEFAKTILNQALDHEKTPTEMKARIRALLENRPQPPPADAAPDAAANQPSTAA